MRTFLKNCQRFYDCFPAASFWRTRHLTESRHQRLERRDRLGVITDRDFEESKADG